MKKTLLSTIALIAIAGSASAADLPSIKSTPAPAPIMSWNGFYAGLNTGYGFGTANNAQNYGWANSNYFGSDSLAFAASYSQLGRNITQGGFIGGGQVGYNYQFRQNFLIGFETDMQGSGISGEGNADGWAPYSQNASATYSFISRVPIQAGINWMGTVRGRIGYLISPTVLAYATGGLAYGGTYLKTFPQQHLGITDGYATALFVSTQNAQQNLNVGWTAGGGAEWMMAPNWSIKGEALYYDLNDTVVSNSTYSGGFAGSIGGSTTRAYYQGVIARAGVNYHFNLANIAPIVAKF